MLNLKVLLNILIYILGLIYILYHRILKMNTKKSLTRIANRSVLNTHQARELGIYQSDDEESDEE